MNVDLHTRSSLSGGCDSPAELVRKAHAAGLSAVALTDLLSVDGLEEATAEAEKLGLEFVPGVEIPVKLLRYEGELKLLGYFFDPHNAALRELLEKAKTEKPTVGQAALALHEAGGLVALADPKSAGAEGMSLEWFMQSVRCCGVEFMEVLYTDYSPDESQFWLDTAKEWSMDPIGGSGYGDASIPAVLGQPETDYEVLAWMKSCKETLSCLP